VKADVATKFKKELDTAEEELPKFDLTNNDKCIICNSVTTQKFICKTSQTQKVWMGAPGERMKWGLVYTKPWNDEKKSFIESADTKCL